ncbi:MULTISPECIES: zinc ribbon domain-containing protein [Geobacter]|uniref:zinc ribbon domain-containing protein n=1 Tax=Geobacter TaxID=28231 RepID=UPI000AFD2871|nr:C4-type zinc ribbon domain-containing protein [Geobacter anodireducens]
MLRKNLMLLEELQELDLKIDGRQGERQALLDQLAELDRQVEEARLAVDGVKSELTVAEEEKRGLEANLAAEDENIVRSEARQKEIKTQKEYQAILKEITAAKKQKGELEEQLIQKTGQVEQLAADIAAREGDLDSLEENLGDRKAELASALERLDQEIASDASAKAETAKGIPASLLKRYEALRLRRQGVALVVARNGNCSGCNMNLPPQLYNSLYRGDDLVLCPHCQRMLVLRQDA